MRIVFMGTPEFAIPCLEVLIHSEHTLECVVTQPDRPKGRGKKLAPPPIKVVGERYHIPVMQPPKVKKEEFISALEELNPDLIVVVAFGQILPKRILDIPQYGCINVHASLLPKYRGAGPIQWSVINGETITGVTTMYMDVGMDTGDMILKEKIPIDRVDTAGSLHDKLSVLGAKVLEKTIKLIEKGDVPRTQQNEEEATYAPMLEKKLGLINWNKSAEDIHNLIRGLNPWPSAYTFYNDEVLKIWKATPFAETYKDFKTGQIVEIINDQGFVVKTGQGSLLVKEIQKQGGKRMSVVEFLKGNDIQKHIVLGVTI